MSKNIIKENNTYPVSEYPFRPFEGCSPTFQIKRNESQEEAVKHDGDKPRVELLPSAALMEIAKALNFGAQKYEDENWRRGFAWKRLIGALLRHVLAWKDGEDKDAESGLSHLAHAGCCLLFLLEHEIKKLGTDDRHRPDATQERIDDRHKRKD